MSFGGFRRLAVKRRPSPTAQRGLPGVASAVLVLAALWAGPATSSEQKTSLTIPEARAVAAAALDEGRPELAYSLSREMLKADPKDPTAYFLIARAQEQLRNPMLGRRAAGYAFRYSKRPDDRFLAAQMAARLSYQGQQYGYAQYWLRRSVDNAPNERLRQQTIDDFRRIARENPLRYQLAFSVAPSDNVNSGTDNEYSTAEGVGGGGVISDDGQPLSGVVIKGGLTGSYRLNVTKTTETRLTAKLQTRQVVLSSAAKRKLLSSPLPSVRAKDGRDFSSTTFEIGLAHSFAPGPQPRNARWKRLWPGVLQPWPAMVRPGPLFPLCQARL